MRVRVRVYRNSTAHCEGCNLDEYVYKALDGKSHALGAVETVDATTQNIKSLVARLVSIMVQKELLAADDVPTLLNNNDTLYLADPDDE